MNVVPIQAIFDRELEQRVRLALGCHSLLRSVEVRVIDGLVTLVATLPNYHARQLAVECVKHVSGVRGITDWIDVKYPTLAPAAAPTQENILANR